MIPRHVFHARQPARPRGFQHQGTPALIDAAWQSRLHAFLGGVAREFGVTVAEAVGGVADHVHLLLSLTATVRLADVMRDLKRSSSAWVHQNFGSAAFAWQDGYGAFSVSAKNLDAVRAYIANQADASPARAPSAKNMSPCCGAAGSGTMNGFWTEPQRFLHPPGCNAFFARVPGVLPPAILLPPFQGADGPNPSDRDRRRKARPDGQPLFAGARG